MYGFVRKIFSRLDALSEILMDAVINYEISVFVPRYKSRERRFIVPGKNLSIKAR